MRALAGFLVVGVVLAGACSGGAWPEGPDGGVVEEPCVDGDIHTRLCGNCGTQQRTCSGTTWGEWSDCGDEGECAAGDSESRGCGSDVGACELGEQARDCSESCRWSGWGECAGGQGPTTESCGNEIDDNCSGTADEGCECAPAEPGEGGSFAVAGHISKLVADPARCLIYGLDDGGGEVVVIDTESKEELTRVPLDFAGDDIDISPDGTSLLVAHDAAHKLTRIDTGLWEAEPPISTLSDPYVVEAADGDLAFYIELDQWVDIHRVDLAAGIGGDVGLGSWSLYAGDAELSSDGTFLLAGESGISGGRLYKYNVGGGGLVQVDESTWDDGYGFPYPRRWVYLAPDDAHVYYAGYQLDGFDLSFVRGATGERIYAEDAAGTFSVGEDWIFDADLVRPVADLPTHAGAAALASADRELWYYGDTTGRIYYQSVDDYLLGVPLGVRDRAPGPLADYDLVQLVADPVRPRLYGLDAGRQSVVVIDTDSMEATAEILVGATPTDLSVDADGTYLYVGHLDMMAVARIDLAAPAFDRFLPTPRDTYEIEALGGGRVATIDQDQWTQVTVIDGGSGAIVGTAGLIYEGALGATADGETLFVGEAYISGGNIHRYAVGSGGLTEVDVSDYDDGYGFPYPERRATPLPDGSGVYYARYLLDGADLSLLRYPQADSILTVTQDGLLALSATSAYAADDGELLGTLEVGGAAQAVSPDGLFLYVATTGGIATVDLAPFRGEASPMFARAVGPAVVMLEAAASP